MLQQFCAVSSGCKKAKSQIQWSFQPIALMVTSSYTRADTLQKSTSATKIHMQLLIVICSKNCIIWTIHWKKVNSPKHILDTKSQSLWGFPFFNAQICESWNYNTNFVPNSMKWTSSKSWKPAQIRCMFLLLKETGRLYHIRIESGMGAVAIEWLSR